MDFLPAKKIVSPRVYIIAILIVIIVVFNFLFLLFFSAPKNFPLGQIVNIEQGSSLRRISTDLKANHLIRSKVVFEAFVVIYDGERHIAPGDYLFDIREPVYEVARRITHGDRRLAPIKVTIPEGFNVSDIANAFALKLPNFNKENFTLLAKDKEGYLFPDTYFLFSTASEQDVLKFMSDNFEKKIASIQPQIISIGKNEKEIIIMASIIEREAKGDADRAVISGILWRRLAIGMPLQVDAVLETYKTKGLPKSPICNPGLEAIKAAVHPENSPYLFYLHDKSGMIHYARTFTEHRANILKYLK